MEGDVAHLRPAGPLACPQEDAASAECPLAASHAVTALYRSHALGMTRLAFIMLGGPAGQPRPSDLALPVRVTPGQQPSMALSPEGTLGAGRLLVLRPRAGQSAPADIFITPDGTKLIGSTATAPFRSLASVTRGELTVYSARTGALLQRLAPWTWHGNDPRGGHGGFPREQLTWSSPSGSQLILLRSRDDLNILGVLAGGRFRTTGAPLPGPAGYQELQYALRTASQVAW